MRFTAFLLGFVNGYKTYVSAILTVVLGIGMVFTRDYEGLTSGIFQTLTLVFGGTSVVGLRHAVAKLEGAGTVGLRHAVADGTPQPQHSRESRRTV
jgi:hypothetical protein